MNLFRRKLTQALIGATALVASASGLTSCDSVIYDDLDPCPEGLALRFIYDYNMEYANAFPAQVHSLNLFVYDDEGKCVASKVETSDVLADENYRMIVDLPAGHRYTCVAYGGMETPESSFSFKPVPQTGSLLKDLSVEMKSAAIGTNLHPLFYGALNVEVPANLTTYTEATVPMMKDTNNLRILLQHLSGQAVNADEFEFNVTENNTLFNYENELLPQPWIDFKPWTKGQVTTGEYDPDSSGDHVTQPGVTLAYAEFGLSRLMVPTKDPATGLFNSPRLIITRSKDGVEIVNIPLIDYLLLLKSEQYSRMGAQEFLDRESRWSMIFFLDKANNWVTTHIVVNDWVVRVNNARL